MNEAAPAYLAVGRRRIPVPRRRWARLTLAWGLMIRGLIPCWATPLLLSAAMTLFSMDVRWVRRWRRKALVALEHRRRAKAAKAAPSLHAYATGDARHVDRS